MIIDVNITFLNKKTGAQGLFKPVALLVGRLPTDARKKDI